MATSFDGFPEGKVRLTPVPGAFFTELLPQIDHLDELKLSLYVFWRLDHLEGAFRYLRRADLLEDPALLSGLGEDRRGAEAALDEALARCTARGTLLQVELPLEEGPERFYFLNSPKGRAAVEAIAHGEWRPSGDPRQPLELSQDQPNIFRLYEEHIGPLTPMIAESLRDAEAHYPAGWIEEAIRLAVENNVRRWNYAQAILERWQQEGRDERKDRRDAEKDRRKYVEGEFSDFIEH